MGKKILIYIGGIVSGIVLTLVVLFIIAKASGASDNDIKYFDAPISFENKQCASFEVFQVFTNHALARESSGYDMYLGKVVLLESNNIPFYTDQVVTINNPKQVGTYSYNSRDDRPLTVPVIKVNNLATIEEATAEPAE